MDKRAPWLRRLTTVNYAYATPWMMATHPYAYYCIAVSTLNIKLRRYITNYSISCISGRFRVNLVQVLVPISGLGGRNERSPMNT